MIDGAMRGVFDQFSYANESSEFIDKIEKKDKMIIEKEQKEPNFDEITFKIGNTHKKQTNDTHLWKVYLQESNDMIKSVTFFLHPTFKNNEILISKAPFEIERTGWGTFAIKMEVILKNGKQFNLIHDLSFDGNGKERIFKLEE